MFLLPGPLVLVPHLGQSTSLSWNVCQPCTPHHACSAWSWQWRLQIIYLLHLFQPASPASNRVSQAVDTLLRTSIGAAA